MWKTFRKNAQRWLDRWLDESGWCAQPPQISTLPERAYDFEPRTLHHNIPTRTSIIIGMALQPRYGSERREERHGPFFSCAFMLQ